MLAYSQGDNAHAIEASDQAIALARRLGEKGLLGIALGFKASGSMFLGRTEGVQEMLEEGLAAARESGDGFAMGLPTTLMASATRLISGDTETTRQQAAQGLELLRSSGDDWGATMALLNGAMLATFSGDYASARSQFMAMEPLFRDLGDQHRVNMVRSELAHLERYEGHYAQAESMYKETIKEWQRIGHRAAVAHQLECFALLAHLREDDRRAATLYGAAEALAIRSASR